MDKVEHTFKLLLILAFGIVVATMTSCGYIKDCRNAKGMTNNACFGGKRSGLIGY